MFRVLYSNNQAGCENEIKKKFSQQQGGFEFSNLSEYIVTCVYKVIMQPQE
jgi:hypothetical protein